MKVGTDAVLLGAWCDVGHIQRVLDIGTGSGIIALMMAQRTDPGALIDAVEMLPEDAAQARENVMASPWPEKITVFHTSIQEFDPPHQYDIIVCNPPYFVKSLLPPDQRRASARHSHTLEHWDLIESVKRLLLPEGMFHVIMPVTEGGAFREEAKAEDLHLTRLTRLYTRHGKPAQRLLMTFGFSSSPLKEDAIYVYGPDRRKTEAYASLTKEFYLDPGDLQSRKSA